MRHFAVTTTIKAPPERVWEVMADIDRWHEWTPSISSITRIDGTFAVGSRVMIKQPQFPPALWRITALEPGRSFTWVSGAPGLRVTGHHAVEPSTDGGSTAHLVLDIQGIFGGFWGWLTKGITERYLDFELRGLKARSENPHAGVDRQP